MNCRTFQKQLEDYLENGMDFAGRFGMERHARQCVRCGRELASAEDLRRRVHDMERVKAPADFEASILDAIAARKLRRRFPTVRRLWVFGFDLPSLRTCALAAGVALALGAGWLAWLGRDGSGPGGDAAFLPPAFEGFRPEWDAAGYGRGLTVYVQTDENDYREYTAIGPDDLPMIVPLPNTIRMQIGLPSEEYFITNVSH